jgi:hypothetical protein
MTLQTQLKRQRGRADKLGKRGMDCARDERKAKAIRRKLERQEEKEGRK